MSNFHNFKAKKEYYANSAVKLFFKSQRSLTLLWIGNIYLQWPVSKIILTLKLKNKSLISLCFTYFQAFINRLKFQQLNGCSVKAPVKTLKNGYTHIPGFGTYRIYPAYRNLAQNLFFPRARENCIKDGGDLAIVDTPAKYKVSCLS